MRLAISLLLLLPLLVGFTFKATPGHRHVSASGLPDNDDFERASLGSNWTQTTGGGDCQIAGSSDLEGSANDTLCFWNANTPNTTSYACGQLSTVDNATYIGPCVGMRSDGDGDAVCCLIDPTTNTWEIDEFVNGVFGSQLASGTQDPWDLGDFVGLERGPGADDFECFRSTNGTSWTSLGSCTTCGSSVPDPGRLGAYVATTTAVEMEVWEGGNGSLPTGSACGTNN